MGSSAAGSCFTATGSADFTGIAGAGSSSGGRPAGLVAELTAAGLSGNGGGISSEAGGDVFSVGTGEPEFSATTGSSEADDFSTGDF